MSQWNSGFTFTFVRIEFDVTFRLSRWRPPSDTLSYRRVIWLIIGHYLDHIRASVVIARNAQSHRASASGKLVYFRLLRRRTNVSRIGSLLTGEVIKFEGFRRRRSRLPTYCVFCDQSALLRLCTRADTAVQKHFSLLPPVFVFLFLSLASSLTLALRSTTSSVLQFLLLSLLLGSDHCRHWSRPGFMDAVPFSRQEMPRPILLRRIATAGTLSRALASSIGIINYRRDRAGPLSSWIIGADARHRKWLPKKRTNLEFRYGGRCFKRKLGRDNSSQIMVYFCYKEMFCILIKKSRQHWYSSPKAISRKYHKYIIVFIHMIKTWSS